jgi:hypothetical protein
MKKTLLTILSLVTLLGGAAHATITWSVDSPGSMFYSTGAYTDANLTIDLGTFGSFTPTVANMDQWASNWKPFDRASATTVPQTYNPTFLSFSSQATVTSTNQSSSANIAPIAPSNPTFAAGEQAYMWVYNTQTYGAGLEWALVTNNNSDGNSLDNWVIPAYAEHPNQYYWYLNVSPSNITAGNSYGTSVVFGGITNNRGPGSYTGDPVDDDPDTPGTQYGVQTATLAAVPEPGSAMLVASVGLLGLLRRRRRA